MRQILTTLFFLTLSVCSFAQTSSNSISISIGPSFPLSSFKRTDVVHETNGFAKTGEHLNICFEHKINNSFALSAMLYGQSNPVNAQEFAKNSYAYTYKNSSYSKGRWLFTGLLVGGSNEFPIFTKKKNLFFNIKSLVGFVYGRAPKFSVTAPSPYRYSNKSFSSNSEIGPAYFLSGGLKYYFHKKYFIVTNLQYFYVSEIKLEQEISSDYYSYTRRITPEVSSINVVAGIGLHL